MVTFVNIKCDEQNKMDDLIKVFLESSSKRATGDAAEKLVEKSVTELFKEINKASVELVKEKLAKDYGEEFVKINIRRIGGIRALVQKPRKVLAKMLE